MARAVLINDTRVDLHHGCTRVIEAIFNLARSNGVEITATAPAHTDWRRSSDFVSEFENAELVIVNGEGTLHHSQAAAGPLLAAGRLARDRSKHSALVNFSWLENDVEMEKALLDFDIVSVRESRSLERVQPVRSDCQLVPDFSLVGSKPKAAYRTGIGFGDSVLEHTSLELLNARVRLGGRIVPIRFTGKGLSGRARFVRSYLSKAVILNASAFASVVRRASATFLHCVPTADDFLTELSKLELFVTGRFHGTALALCSFTPVLAMRSNTDKLEALLHDAQLEPWRLIEPSDLTPDILTRASHWSRDERKAIDAYLASAKSSAERLFSDIASLVRRP